MKNLLLPESWKCSEIAKSKQVAKELTTGSATSDE